MILATIAVADVAAAAVIANIAEPKIELSHLVTEAHLRR